MNEIKSVRVRKNNNNTGVLDIKVSLFEDNKSKTEVVLTGVNNSNTIWRTKYTKDGIYKDFSNDDFIKNFIILQSKVDNSKYDIIQDPWQESVPKWRSYGFDPYYVNNGSMIYINWLDGNTSVGGKKYSDTNGDEINVDTTITKTVKIINSPNNIIIEIDSDGSFKYPKNIKSGKKYSSTIKDIDIIKEVISKWNSMIPGYSLDICSPSNESCSLIEFKDPLNIKDDNPPVLKENTENTVSKIKLNPVLPIEKLKVKFDFSIKVYLGEPKVDGSSKTDEFEFQSEDSGLDPEFSETSFEGSDETTFLEEIPLTELDLGDSSYPTSIHNNSEPIYTPSGIYKGGVVGGFNIDKAVKALNSNSNSNSLGKCAKFVRFALEAGGINTNGRPGSAKDYDGFLENRGFTILNKSGYNPKVGDIIVMESFQGKKFHEHGHIQMWNGEKWVSDFRQSGFWPGGDYRTFKPSYKIIRKTA